MSVTSVYFMLQKSNKNILALHEKADVGDISIQVLIFA